MKLASNLTRNLLLATVAASGLFMATPAKAILVGQCIEFTACYSSSSPTPWSHTLTTADLIALGLGTSEPLIASQTSQFIIRLGVTTITFTTLGGPVTSSLPEF